MKKTTYAIITFVFLTLVCWAQDPTVYITKTGEKYHNYGCRYLSRSCIPIQLSAAIARGYTPCSVCRPPTSYSNLDNSASQQQTVPDQIYRVNIYNISRSSDADISKMLPATVTRHIDGDTIEVTINSPPPNISRTETIRLIGVDTPETVDPRREVQPFGMEASEYTKTRLLNKKIYLAFENNFRDQYKRLLAYVYLLDGTCFNAEIINLGYAHAYIEYPFQFMEEFIKLEEYARNHKLGLWK